VKKYSDRLPYDRRALKGENHLYIRLDEVSLITISARMLIKYGERTQP